MATYSGTKPDISRASKAATSFGIATRAYLTCGAAGSSDPAAWAALTNTAGFTITVNGTACADLNPDFTGCATMGAVEAALTSVLNAAKAGTIATWSTDHFIITGPGYGDAATISVLTAPGILVDLAGAAWLNGKAGTGVATAGTNGKATLFTVAGGKVKIKDIVGEVTTIMQTKTTNVKLVSNPTVGADVDLCAVNDVTADAVGTMYNITGTLADAMVATTSGAFKSQANGVIVNNGTIELNVDTINTGATKWVVTYEAIDAGATIS